MDWDGKGRERMIWDGGIENSETLGVLSGEVDEAVEIPLPEVLRDGVAAGLAVADPARDGAVVFVRHGTLSAVSWCTPVCGSSL